MPYKDKDKQREAVRNGSRKKRTFRRKLLLEDKSCERCGFNDWRALEFHHRNNSDKVMNVMSLLTNKLDSILLEIEKCEIVCANCHAIEHSVRQHDGQ